MAAEALRRQQARAANARARLKSDARIPDRPPGLDFRVEPHLGHGTPLPEIDTLLAKILYEFVGRASGMRIARKRRRQRRRGSSVTVSGTSSRAWVCTTRSRHRKRPSSALSLTQIRLTLVC